MEAAINAYQDASARDSRERLILDHVDYVRHVLGRLLADWPPGIDEENLEAAGILGLVQAADQFDADRGVPFRAFATRRIRGAVIDELRRNSPLPQHMLEKLGRVRTAYREIGPRATTRQIAEQTGLSTGDVESCLDAERLTRITSWDEELHQNLLGEAGRPDDPGAAVEKGEQKALLADGIEQLPRRERNVLTMYYVEDLRLKEIGCVLGLSESRISRILTQAEIRLGEYVRRRLS